MPGVAALNVRPAVTADCAKVQALLQSIDPKAGGLPWSALDTYDTGWAEVLRTSRCVVVEPTDWMQLGNGNRPDQQGDQLLAVISARKRPTVTHGWLLEAEIVTSPTLGPAQLRTCENEARRLARRLSARYLQLRWYPQAGTGDRVVKIQTVHGMSGI